MSKSEIWPASDVSYFFYTEDYKLISKVLPVIKRKATDIIAYERAQHAFAWQIEFEKKYLVSVNKVIKDYERNVV